MVYSFQDNSKLPKIILKIGQRTLKPRGIDIYDGYKYTCYIQVFLVRQPKSHADSVQKSELSSGDFKNYAYVIKLCHMTPPYIVY